MAGMAFWYKHRALCAGQRAIKKVLESFIVEFELQLQAQKVQLHHPKKKSQMNEWYAYIYRCRRVLGGSKTVPSYSTTAAPPTNARDIIPTDSSVVGEGCHRRIPLDARANVVANCAVGFGPPLTDTVGLDDKGLAVELPPESTMENFGELAYMPPWVLFRNRMK